MSERAGMTDHEKTKQQLIEELAEMRGRVVVLQESEKRFHKYFHQDLIGMAAVTLDSRWLDFNQRLCDILGYSRDELLRKNWKDLSHPDDLEVALAHFHRLVSGEVNHYTIEKRYIRKDGSTVYTMIAVQAFYREDRTIDCVVGLMEDITARKQAEEGLKRKQETLRHLLQSSDHERQMIAYEIHDGLAQQLAGAIMQFQTFAHLKDTKPEAATKAYAAGMTMLQQGHFETRRLISGVRPPILDEEGIVAAVAHLINEERRKNGPKIEYLSRVEFDRLTPILENAVYRIVQEALVNACMHSKSEKVSVEVVQCDDLIRIEIEDWGVGFKPEDVQEGRFGLAGIRERARLLGGKADIVSEPDKGTRIVAELPIVLRRREDE